MMHVQPCVYLLLGLITGQLSTKTTSMVGLKNGHIRKNLTKNGESRDIAGNAAEKELAVTFKVFSIVSHMCHGASYLYHFALFLEMFTLVQFTVLVESRFELSPKDLKWLFCLVSILAQLSMVL